jgi:outer membrane protein assembly factor BamB
MKQFIAPLALLLLVAAVDPDLEPRLRREPVSPTPGWPKYCGTTSMSGMPTGRSTINARSVRTMTLAWRTALGGPVASAPSVVGHRLYVGDWSGHENMIEVHDGTVLARADLGLTTAPQCEPQTLGITSSAAIENGVLYVAGGDDAFYALDANTLAVLWRKSLGDNSANGGYYGWSSPAVVGNRVLQGVASNCDNPFVQGRLVAMDSRTGSEVASARFVGDGGVGSGVWTSPAVDMQNGKVFVTTGSGVDFFDGTGYSIVRLDLATLKLEDMWKVSEDEAYWDADWGSSPTLFRDASGTQFVGAGHKDGHYYAFLRSDLGAGPVWSAEIATSGEIPQQGDGTLSTAAFDGTRLYVGGGNPPDASDAEAHGSVVALDPATGAVLWRQTFPGAVIAPVSTVNGVVFAAGGNLVEALDAATGAVLWSTRTDAPLYGGISIAADTIYVGDLSGTLYAFRIR